MREVRAVGQRPDLQAVLESHFPRLPVGSKHRNGAAVGSLLLLQGTRKARCKIPVIVSNRVVLPAQGAASRQSEGGETHYADE